MTAARLILLAALALAPAALAAQEAAEAPAPGEATAEAEAPAVALPAISVSEVGTRLLRDRVIASGLVAAVETVQVQPLVEGQSIEELLVDVGDRVEAGQVLARLRVDTIDLELSQLEANGAQAEAAIAQAQASLAQAQANADEAQRQASRNAELAEAGSVPRAQADQAAASSEAAAAQVRVAEQGIASARAQAALVAAQVENAQLRLARTEVKAPVAGLVTARNAQVGGIASGAGAPMFTIVRDGAMELRAEVAEMDLLRLAPGQTATLRASSSGPAIEGTVRLVEPLIDPQTRLGTARITIEPGEAGAGVVEGMFLSAEILVGEEEVPAVPVTALGSDEGETTVMRVEGDTVARVPVQTGIRDGAWIGIESGIGAGELVVTKAAAFVRDGDRINPVREDPAAAPADDQAADAGAVPATDLAAGDAAPQESPVVEE